MYESAPAELAFTIIGKLGAELVLPAIAIVTFSFG
jgi:hypothetical protein